MELVECKEMFEVLNDLGNYSEAVASGIMKQIFTGLSYLHSNGVCHRDIKPNNILVSQDGKIVKITDFNVSKFINKKDIKNKYSCLSTENYKMWTHTGTIAFTAPEVFLDCEYTESVDIWSAGVVLYTMLCGYQPFQSDEVQDLIESIKEGKYTFHPEQWDDISEQAKDLISHCLDVNTNTRYSLSDALMHPWIAHNGQVSNIKITLKDEFRVYYKQLRNSKEPYSCNSDMKKVQVISPSLVNLPTCRHKRRCISVKMILEDFKPKFTPSEEEKVSNTEKPLSPIEESWIESSPLQKKSDMLWSQKAHNLNRKLIGLTNLMLKEQKSL